MSLSDRSDRDIFCEKLAKKRKVEAEAVKAVAVDETMMVQMQQMQSVIISLHEKIEALTARIESLERVESLERDDFAAWLLHNEKVDSAADDFSDFAWDDEVEAKSTKRKETTPDPKENIPGKKQRCVLDEED